MRQDAHRFSTWLDDFFVAYYQRRPVNATFVGVHDHNNRLPDYSEQGVGDTVDEIGAQIDRFHALPDEPLTSAQRLDRELAVGYLAIQQWEFSSQHFHRGNPSLYTGEAIFGILSLFLTAHLPKAQKVEAAVARMETIPTLLAQGEQNVRTAPLDWTERAIRECTGALAFFQDGIHHLARQERIVDPRFLASAEMAAGAFVRFQRYLQEKLRANPADHYACGAEAFDLLMRCGHFVDMSADEIVRYAEAQMAEAQAYLNNHASDFGATGWQAALAGLADRHPTVNTYYDRYTEIWQDCRATAEDHDLVTWPDFPIRYVPRPAWSREAAPYLYFLFYRSPAAYNRPAVHNYLVTPIDETMPMDKQEALLRANNDSVIKLNHVVHHGSIGHHVQNWNAFHAESRIGRMAAVDCASRIAMFCGGTMAEGWACYTTDLMDEIGFLTPLESYAEKQSRRRMCARAIVDVRLHLGQMRLDDATAFYQQHAGMNPSAAHGEAVKNSMFPGGAMMYLIGTDRIKQLRAEMKRKWGPAFNLRRFHDEFLAYGSVPVSLIAKSMEEKARNAQ